MVRDRRFAVFNLPVDREDTHDYYDIIENPICLTQIMSKIDDCAYSTKEEFMDDIRLIRFNAIEYNPEKDMESRF